MGFWNTLLKGAGRAVGATGKTVGSAVIHPAQTVRTAGSAVKTAAVGAGVGYVAWEKLTSDKSVARIVSEAVVGEQATDKIASTADDVKELKDKASQAVDTVSGAVDSMNSKWDGVTNFIRNITGGNAMDMFGNFFSNLGKGNVSGLGIVGLIAAAFLTFGRFGWLGKIAGALLGMLLIGGNSQSQTQSQAQAQQRVVSQVNDNSIVVDPELDGQQRSSGGMRR